jgi:hypothetical protein
MAEFMAQFTLFDGCSHLYRSFIRRAIFSQNTATLLAELVGVWIFKLAMRTNKHLELPFFPLSGRRNQHRFGSTLSG